MKPELAHLEGSERCESLHTRHVPSYTHMCAEAVNTGPLEATITSLTREIDAKGGEGRELQRRWIAKQTELVTLQVGPHAPALEPAWLRKYVQAWRMRSVNAPGAFQIIMSLMSLITSDCFGQTTHRTA
jgi:hypothetical protein